MATTLTSFATRNIGTVAAALFTVPASTSYTVLGLTTANTTANPVTCDIFITRSSNQFYVIKGATIPVGGSLVTVGGDQKLIALAGDVLNIVASASSAVDAIASVMATT